MLRALTGRVIFLCLAQLSVACFYPVAAFATEQFPPTILRQNADDSWKLQSEYLGGHWISSVDVKGPRLTLWIRDALSKAEFNKYVKETTAGPKWEDYALHYFATIDKRPHFCIRTWWGRRILIDLTADKQVADERFQETLRSAEEATVMDRLGAGVFLAKGDKFRYQYEIQQALAAAYWAGRLPKMEKAAAHLVELEKSDYMGSCSFQPLSGLSGDFEPSNHCVYEFRRLAQLSLRRIGVKPAGYPATSMKTQPKNDRAQMEAPAMKRHASRALSADRVKRDMPALEVLEALGPPDYVDSWDSDAIAWRYDMDSAPQYSLLVLIEQNKVKSVEQVKPALWHGSDLIAAGVKELVFDADGSIINPAALRAHYGKADRGKPARS
jgi:hypothetical protein